MKILNIHGYKGSSENSACSVLKHLGFEVISPEIDYDFLSPENVLDILSQIIVDSDITYIVGTSLGGFFGAVLSARFNIPAILVNPCFLPFVTLPRLDFSGDIRPYVRIFPEIYDINISITSTIIGGQDEIIDYHDFTEKLLGNKNFRIVPDGKHSGATLPLESYFREILSD